MAFLDIHNTWLKYKGDGIPEIQEAYSNPLWSPAQPSWDPILWRQIKNNYYYYKHLKLTLKKKDEEQNWKLNSEQLDKYEMEIENV